MKKIYSKTGWINQISNSKTIRVIGLLILCQLLITQAFGQGTYYIDPGYTGASRTGSMTTPYKSLSDFSWSAGSTYLIKSGTTLDVSTSITVTGNNVTLGSYGSGARPVINSKVIDGTRVMVVRGDNVKVMNLDVRAIDNGPMNSAGCVIDMIGPRNAVLDNVKTTGGNRGINASQTKGRATIINCHVTDTWDDGMYHRTNDTVIIENTLVERVNMKYKINPDQTYAGGDNIQFDYVTHFEIRNCVLDKTHTGGKFMLIADHFVTGITENTKLIGATMQHGVYLGIGDHFIYRYNILSGCQYGLWNKTVAVDAYYNVFKSAALAAYQGDSQVSSNINNNIFISNGEAIAGWNERMKVNNNIFYNNGRNVNGNMSYIVGSYNCYFPANPGSNETNSFKADPLFTNIANDDYSLRSGSPCIDKGIKINGMTSDYLSASVPNGTTTDIGAYEFGGTSTPPPPPPPPATNNPPVVKITAASVIQGATVAGIDASQSSDADGDKLTYSWVSNNGLFISGKDSSKMRFLAPDVASSQNITFVLTVSDGKESKSSTITMSVQPFKTGSEKAIFTSVDASAFQDPNTPQNAVDGNIATRWSAEGDNNWLQMEMAGATSIGYIKLAVASGTYRNSIFDVLASSDNVTWDILIQNMSTCGISDGIQAFDIAAGYTNKSYKYIKLVGHSNTENAWNSYTEFQVFGTEATKVPEALVVNVVAPATIEGAKVSSLDASSSKAPDGGPLSYSWVCNSGVNIVAPNASKIEFLAPDVAVPTTVTFELSVTDGKTTSQKNVDVLVQPYKPAIPQITCSTSEAGSFQDPNVAANLIDGDLTTRWSADGDNSWIVTELKTAAKLSHVKIAYYNGNFRIGDIDVLGSKDNVTWEVLLQNTKTSGLCVGSQAFDIPVAKSSVDYKYVKIVGHGNSENTWNSITEMKVYGTEVAVVKDPVINVSFSPSVPGAKVATLDASASTDPDGKPLTYSWISKDGIQISSATDTKISFLAPDVAQNQTISFDLSVTNGTESATKTVQMIVQPYNPSIAKVRAMSAEASAFQDPNTPQNAIDGSTTTRWSAEGDNSWLSMNLEAPAKISFVKLAFSNGHYRNGFFDIQMSNDNSNWVNVLQNMSTCGLSEGNQAFEIPATHSNTAYKYVRLVGRMNSENAWNSYIEVAAYGQKEAIVEVPVDPPVDETPDGGQIDDKITNKVIYYIDPTYTGTSRTGTITNPYKAFSDFTWQAGAAYLIKSGTTIEAASTITITPANITLASYGTGARPIIASRAVNGTRSLTVRGDYVRVMNIEVHAIDNGPDASAGCVIDMIGPRNPVLNNVKTKGGERGINASQTKGRATVINCHITDTWDDGMYNRTNDTVIIENTLVERVNLKYHINPVQTYAGGDCIQFDYITHFEIRNCTLDKTFTGGKFLLIADHFESGITENSKLIGTRNSHGVYLGIGNYYTYRYNTLSGCQYGVWNKTIQVELYYNIFKNTGMAAYYGESQKSSIVYNNLFNACGEAIAGWNEKMKVNNNIFFNNSKNIAGNMGNISAGYNCYYPGSPSSSETKSFSANPQFTNATSDNYELTALSPCINAGLTISTMKQDMVQSSLPQGSSSDVGPIEFVVSTQKSALGGMDNTNSIEHLIIKDFNMYPNPSMGAINLDFSGNLDSNVSRVRIINLNGKLEYEEVYSESIDKILINHNLMDGMYVLQVIFEDGFQTTKKLIVRTP